MIILSVLWFIWCLSIVFIELHSSMLQYNQFGDFRLDSITLIAFCVSVSCGCQKLIANVIIFL